LSKKLEYKWADTLCAASGNQFGIYISKNIPSRPPTDENMINLWRLNIKFDPPTKLLALAEKYKSEFYSHYSSANADGKSWTALVLRGYYDSHQECLKPEEMSQKWKKENGIKNVSYDHMLHDTEMGKIFLEELKPLFDALPGKKHRIRLLRLEPGGKILKHCDKPCPTDPNNIWRYHIPLLTNPHVEIHSWNLRAEEIVIPMKVGEVWRIDNRKPHAVFNKGTTPRIHLVMDIEECPQMDVLLASACQIRSIPEDQNNLK